MKTDNIINIFESTLPQKNERRKTMFGSEDKYKKFTNFCGEFLDKQKQDRIDNPVLSSEQIKGANDAKNELKEKKTECPLITLETQNSILKKHIFASSSDINVTPNMIKSFNSIALGD